WVGWSAVGAIQRYGILGGDRAAQGLGRREMCPPHDPSARDSAYGRDEYCRIGPPWYHPEGVMMRRYPRLILGIGAIIGTLLSASITSSARAQAVRFVAAAGDDGGGTNTCVDPGAPCATIARAISAASAGHSIRIGERTFTESVIIDKSVHVQGAGASGGTTIQAFVTSDESDRRVITIVGEPDVVIEAVLIRFGRADGASGADARGGGIYADGGTLTLRDVELQNNFASEEGGAIYAENMEVHLINVAVIRNGANERGGGIASMNADVRLEDGDVRLNEAGIVGGGLDVRMGSVAVSGTAFSTNSALVGAGMATEDLLDAGTLEDVRVFENTAAGGSGGGMYNQQSSPSLTGCTFEGNTAMHGGGMTNVASSPPLMGVAFTANEATEDGGGMFNAGASAPELDAVIFTANMAKRGGGVYNATSVPVMTGVQFLENTAEEGGGMVNEQSGPTIEESLFRENRASLRGGGMANVASAPSLKEVTFIRNEAVSAGGAMYSAEESAPSLVSVTISQNDAKDGGGLANFSGSAAVLLDVDFSGNTAAVFGGAIN